MSAVNTAVFVGNISYIMLRGHCWCNVIALNGHAPVKDKRDDQRDSFYGELKKVFCQFPSTTWKLSDFSIEFGTEIFLYRQVRKILYMKVVMTMVLVYSICHTEKPHCKEHNLTTLKHSKINLDLS
jgi:hypothetical protein